MSPRSSTSTPVNGSGHGLADHRMEPDLVPRDAGMVVNPASGSSDGVTSTTGGRSYRHGGVLDPSNGAWLPLPDAPSGETNLTGYGNGGPRFLLNHSGWVFEPSTGSWFDPGSPPGAPDQDAAVVWIGDALAVWGGVEWTGVNGELLDTGRLWSPPPIQAEDDT